MPKELYRFLSSEGGIKTLLNRSLRYSKISALNDPYDMLFGITDLPEEAGEDVNYLALSLHLREITGNMVGVISFSARCNEPTMWAHYADNYRGMCLVFDPSVLPEGAFTKVKYGKKRPSVSFNDLQNIGGGNGSGDIFSDELLATKSDSWAYEEEYRLIAMHCGDKRYNGFMSMPNGFLKRVILGFDCDYSPSNIRSILNASGYHDTRIQIARLHTERFEVDVCDYLRVDMGDIRRHETDRIAEKLKEAEEAFLKITGTSDTK